MIDGRLEGGERRQRISVAMPDNQSIVGSDIEQGLWFEGWIAPSLLLDTMDPVGTVTALVDFAVTLKKTFDQVRGIGCTFPGQQ